VLGSLFSRSHRGAATRKPPRDGSTHWSYRKLAALGVNKDIVQRVLAGGFGNKNARSLARSFHFLK
jgi:hypothetical protein